MESILQGAVSRRALLAGAGAITLGAFIPHLSYATENERRFHLIAQPADAALAGPPQKTTPVWAYNKTVPGPEIRVRQGDRLRVTVENRLDEETTVHWHGLRVPNAMDGVPHLTQKPIPPGATFEYSFDVPDAGTYWYHPHQRGFEQVGRGLYGPLIVEEPNPPEVDRDVVWVLDDWRLQPDGKISDDFGHMHDVSHGGRVGNTVTINGRVPAPFPVRSGERIRLRLINAANARVFRLNFSSLNPTIIAYDGQPVTPHTPPGNNVLLGSAMRIDLMVDVTGASGERIAVRDTAYRRMEFDLVEFTVDQSPRSSPARRGVTALPANTMPEPDLARATRHNIEFGGGMMGGMMSAMMGGRRTSMRDMMHNGKAWTINGVAATGHIMEPMLSLQRGRTYILALDNQTAWHHPIHLHGHSFRVLSRNGSPAPHKEWQDTVFMSRREKVEIAFVADNPGDWMFHCHILEHQAGGMMGVIRVSA